MLRLNTQRFRILSKRYAFRFLTIHMIWSQRILLLVVTLQMAIVLLLLVICFTFSLSFYPLVILVCRGYVTSLKLSPNLRKMPKVSSFLKHSLLFVQFCCILEVVLDFFPVWKLVTNSVLYSVKCWIHRR